VTIRVATLTLSDTRTLEDDEGGKLLGGLLVAAGFEIASHAIVREDRDGVLAAIADLANDESVDAIVMTGGTGIAPRDITVETVAPLFEKTLDGFGEAFRRLSFDEIGPNAILSRAIAGVVRSRVVIALPGSPKAVKLAIEKLVAPTLEHACGLASGRAVKHSKPKKADG
jgi:molybdenum cofactor biosynthesis protein B